MNSSISNFCVAGLLGVTLIAGHLAFAAKAADAPAGVYRLSPDFPKYVTAHVEMRDPTGVRWPSLFYGKPASNGTLSIDEKAAPASFTLKCDQRPQKNGDQSRRVLGELFSAPDNGEVTLQVSGLESVTKSDKTNEFTVTFRGTLDITAHKIPFTAPGMLRRHAAGRTGEKNEAIMGEMNFQIRAGEIGLKTFPSETALQVRAAFTAYAGAARGVRIR